MVRGAMDGNCIVELPAEDGSVLYLVYERHTAFCICLIGGTGVGKSATCNILCGDAFMHEEGYLANTKDKSEFTFHESGSSKSCTSTTVPRHMRWLGDGVHIMLVDTPGLSDTGGAGNDQKQLADMAKSLRRVPGVTVFLIVQDDKVRWTKEQDEVLEVFDAVFSAPENPFLDHCAFLYNKSGDELFGKRRKEKRMTKQTELADNLREIFLPELNEIEKMKQAKQQRYDYSTYDFSSLVMNSTLFFPRAQEREEAEDRPDERRRRWAHETLEQLATLASTKELFNTKEAQEGETEATRMAKEMQQMQQMQEQAQEQVQAAQEHAKRMEEKVAEVTAQKQKLMQEKEDLALQLHALEQRQKRLDAESKELDARIAEAQAKGVDTTDLETVQTRNRQASVEVDQQMQRLRREGSVLEDEGGQLEDKTAVEGEGEGDASNWQAEGQLEQDDMDSPSFGADVECNDQKRQETNDPDGSSPHDENPDAYEYDAFLSYRVWCDADVVEKVYWILTSKGLRVFWDKQCLVPGAPWEDGFVQGLKRSRHVVAFVSEQAVMGIADGTAAQQPDNVLKEWELAVDKLTTGQRTYIVPVLLGRYVSVAKGGEALQKFGAFGEFNSNSWPAAHSTTCRTRTICDTMQQLFSVQVCVCVVISC